MKVKEYLMITERTRIIAALEHRTLDRIPICEQDIWPETIARWEKEGLPKGQSPTDYFGLDRIHLLDVADWSFFPHEIYEDNEEYCVDLNGQGTVVKWPRNSVSYAGHEELDHKVKTMADWREARKCLDVDERRFKEVKPGRSGDFRCAVVIDHYWTSFLMFGMEELCCWLGGKPNDLKEIYQDYTDFLLGMLSLWLKRKISFDAVWLFSDMAFKSGPMFSPKTYREVIKPSYDRIRCWCTEHDKYLFLHTDGNMDILLPEVIETGFDLVHPLEARAGNDVRELKGLYGNQITFMGNINTDILAEGNKEAIKDEIASKVTTAKANGGYLYNIDHSVPPTISFEIYSYAIELIKKYGKY